jgi:Ca2+-binding RTX toxin-like protein
LASGMAAFYATTGARTANSSDNLLGTSEGSASTEEDISISSSDTTKPMINIRTPADGATFALNQDIRAEVTCKDEDGRSGIASCLGPLVYGEPIDTGSTGSKTFTVKATDNAGNTRSVTRTYTVVDNEECTILGTEGDDVLYGTSDNDVICGLGGNDTLKGGEGNDTLKGGEGNDILKGGEGSTDELSGDEGDDTLDGGLGDSDIASYRSSATAIEASLVSHTATGEGVDTLEGIENLKGSNYIDKLSGDYRRNVLAGFGGSDELSGLGGDDTLWGGIGQDTLWGGSGNDEILGQGGEDELYGEDGDDSIYSATDDNSAKDSLDGGAGTNTCTTDTVEKSIVNCA